MHIFASIRLRNPHYTRIIYKTLGHLTMFEIKIQQNAFGKSTEREKENLSLNLNM